ncbi:uncharacterized protein LOC136062030 [Quercus suber]|uniref:uncharacterized protein LOC136062030 n=1 Tax=Quercus suber TaxID=58331 RepID=UPI0032E013CE
MDRSQFLNAPPYFDGSNYAFWKVRMRAFLCLMDETVWDVVDIGWTRPEAAKSTWDKATLAASNANSKALNAIFYGVSLEEFHRISHISIAKETWQILETTYEGTKKVKDTKQQMLTTRFKELKMSEDESFDSFYSKLNEVVIGKFNLGEKTEDSKVLRKIFCLLPESFRAKVTAIEKSKDLDDIKVQELIGSLQTYELSLPTQRKRKSLALKTINERMEAHDSSDEDVVDEDVAYLVKFFWKFLKFKNNGNFGDKGKFQSSGREKKEFRKKDGKESQSTQGITCFEYNERGHFKKECPNYLKSKGKAYAITLSDSDSSNSDSKESYDGEGNYSAFMTIAYVESSEDLNLLVQELGEYSDEESMRIVAESNGEEDESTGGLQENFNSLLEKSGEYARVAKVAVKKMKKAKEDYRIQANAKVERVSTKKLDVVISSQKQFSDKSGLGYTGESSSVVKITKEVKFVQAKELVVVASTPKIVGDEKRKNVDDQRVLNKPHNQLVIKLEPRGKSLLRSQRGPRTNHFYHHCGLQGHTKPNCHKLRALKNATDQRSRGPRNDKRTWAVESSRDRNGDLGVMDVMKMIGAFAAYLESFNRRFENPNYRTQSYRDITPNAHDVWVKKGTRV